MLTVREHMILRLHDDHPRDNGRKHELMREHVGMGPARYYQALLEIVQRRDAVEAYPMLCKRVLRDVTRRSRSRSGAILGR